MMERVYQNFKVAFFEDRLWEGSVLGGGCPSIRPLYVERHRGARLVTAPTVHDHWEFTVVSEGQLTLQADRSLELGGGTVALMPPGMPHHERALKDVDTYWLGFRAELPGVARDKVFEVRSDGLLKRVQELWTFSIRNNGPVGPELDGMTMAVVGHFFRRVKEGDGRGKSLFQDAAEYMNERFHEDISMAALAAARGCSVGHFHRQFKAAAGTTPLEYLTALRLKTAVFYLENTEFPVNQVGRLCGFDDPYYFSRAFKKALGVSPQLHRQRVRGGEMPVKYPA